LVLLTNDDLRDRPGDALFDAHVQMRCCLEPRQESFKDEAGLVA